MPAPKSPISSTDLRQQKKGAEARLEALRQEQVDAIEEGSDLPHNNEILVVTERLAALDKAIARAERREAAEEARRERAEQRDEVRRQQEALQTSEQVYLDLLADAEKATGELVRLLRSVDAHSRELYRIGIGARDFLRRHGQPSDEPNELSGPNLSDRLGSYLSSTLCDIRRGTNAPDRLGMVTWQNVAPMNTSWAEAEKRALAGNRNQKLRVLDRVLVALQESPDEAE